MVSQPRQGPMTDRKNDRITWRSTTTRAVLTCLGALGPPGWWGPKGMGWRRSTFYQRIRQCTSVRSQARSDMTNYEVGKNPWRVKTGDWTGEKYEHCTKIMRQHSWVTQLERFNPSPSQFKPWYQHIVLCVGLFQMQTAKLKSIVYSS